MLIDRYFLAILLLFSGYCVNAQSDTTLVLPEAEVVATTLRRSQVGSIEKVFDVKHLKNYTGQTLPDLLERETGIYLKNYGIGSATSSFRGGSASQTAVSWNGLPLQSPMLGQLDFSLMPLGIVEEVGIQYGNHATAWGSGAIGGAIHLSNKAPVNKEPEVSWNVMLGSFDQLHQQLDLSQKKGAWSYRTRVFHQKAGNNFPYRLNNGEEKVLQHAAMKQQGVVQEAYWQSKRAGQFSFQSWYQNTFRELPPTTVQTRSAAVQLDEFWRNALSWKMYRNKVTWQARLGFFHEVLDYQNELILLKSVSRFSTAMAEAEATVHLNEQQQLQFTLSNFWTTADSEGYNNEPTQNQTAVIGNYRQHWGKSTVQVSLRGSLVDGKMIPLIPSLGIEGPVTTWMQYSGRIGRSYRLPTLNDQYWVPGGNLELKPEQGWSQEVSLILKPLQSRSALQYRITAFNRNIEDWILWSIGEEDAFWSASNVTEVWSRGLEQRLSTAFRIGPLYGKWSLGYDYIRSTNQKTLQRPSMEAGEQLIYTPVHNAFSSLRLTFKQWSFFYQHWYKGDVNGVNVEKIPAFQLGSLTLSYTQLIEGKEHRMFFSIENIWDETYRVVERRPMPGRYFRFGMNINFSVKQTKSNIDEAIINYYDFGD
jgi:iron complex outermembrane receptor protein